MFLIARVNPQSDREADWLIALSPKADQIQVTQTRMNARRFKQEADASSVCDMARQVAPEYRWRVVVA